MLRKIINTSFKSIQILKWNKSMGMMAVITPKFYFSTKDPKNNPDNKSSGATIDESFKQQSKQFYNNQVQKIIELNSSADFQKIVTSIKQPIILDLYADWCQPCKVLTPRLENKVKTIQNVKMLKINIDKCPEIAQALKVKTVPTVYLIYQGQAVDRFEGNVGEPEFNKFFETLSKVTGESPQSNQAIQKLQLAKKFLSQQKVKQAAQTLQGFKQKKVPNDLLAIKQLLLTQCYLSLGKASKFKDSIQRASKHESFFKQAPDLNQFYQILKTQIAKFDQQSKHDPSITEFTNKIQKASNKQERLAAKFQLVSYYKGKQMTQNALQTAMEIIKEDKNWSEKKTNQLVLAIFKQLGNNSPLVQKYRKVFQRLLS